MKYQDIEELSRTVVVELIRKIRVYDQSVVASASGLIIGDTSIDISSVMVGIEDRQMEMEPVSYTHLDVYKRQVLKSTSPHNYALFMAARDLCDKTEAVTMADLAEPEVIDPEALRPVSYTHLMQKKMYERLTTRT